jgi:hypothetical protein
METLILERRDRLIFTNLAAVVKQEELADELKDSKDWQIDKSSPYIKWISGDFVEADNPNSNTQFWTKGDLALSEYSIRYAPLNMLHKQRVPVGFYAATRTIDLTKSPDNAASQGTAKIQALSGMWSHIFPFEAQLVDQADAAGTLFYSMECRGTHLHCAGDSGCDQTFEYMAADTHCQHLQERSSIRHIVNPTFRGGALIIPPVQPGWKNAKASVVEDAIKDEASKWAEQTETAYLQVNAAGADLSANAWEQLMAQIVALSER